MCCSAERPACLRPILSRAHPLASPILLQRPRIPGRGGPPLPLHPRSGRRGGGQVAARPPHPRRGARPHSRRASLPRGAGEWMRKAELRGGWTPGLRAGCLSPPVFQRSPASSPPFIRPRRRTTCSAPTLSTSTSWVMRADRWPPITACTGEKRRAEPGSLGFSCCFSRQPCTSPSSPSAVPLPRSSFYRCFTVHATNNLLLQHNVAFDVQGHCFYVEASRGGACRCRAAVARSACPARPPLPAAHLLLLFLLYLSVAPSLAAGRRGGVQHI